MNINTRELGFVNFNNKEMQWVKFNGKTVYEAWKNLPASGIPPLTLLKSKGSDLVDYKLYGNSVQEGTPTPDTPVEIESVGDKTDNIFDVDNANVFNGYIGQEKLQAYGTPVSTIGTFAIKIKPNTTYTVTREITGSRFRIATSPSEPMQDVTFTSVITNYTSKFLTITSGANDYYLYVWFYHSDYDSYTYQELMAKIQVVEGSGIKEWEPYGYKIPVKVSGKNLLNPNIESTQISTYRYTLLSTKPKELMIKLIDKDTSVDISNVNIGFTTNGKDANGGYRWIINNGKIQSTKTNITSANGQTLEHPMMYFSVYPTNQETWEKIFKRFYIQIEEDFISTEYEPYQEPITTYIYLNEPLRKIGDYKDYIDFKSKKVVRNIYNEIITTVSSVSSDNSTYKKFLSYTSKNVYANKAGSTAAYVIGFAMSNKFIQNQENYNQLGKLGGYIQTYLTSSNASRLAFTFDDTSITTVAQAQEKIGDGFEVCYVLAEPDDTETIELQNIPTLKGTTIIEVDTEVQPSNMEVIYKGKPA